MPQPTTSIHLPQPCAESWDAMTPASGGRHCAACQKTVVDFTFKTDAEILAYFKQAGAAIPCGRFRASQLARPLRPVVSTSPVPRWRGWLAAVLAMWSLRAEATSAPPASAVPPSAQHPRRKAAPAPRTRQVAGRLVRGVVRGADGLAPLAQAKVRLKGTHRTAITDANGYFRLWVPARRGPHTPQALVVQQEGFIAKTVRVPLAARAAQALKINLVFTELGIAPDLEPIRGGEPRVVEESVTTTPSAPANRPPHILSGAPKLQPTSPRNWAQRLTQPFRRASSAR
jgi:hypothetical protein